MTRFFYFVAKSSRSYRSHNPTYVHYYKVESSELLNAWRAVREKEPRASIYALDFNAEERYKGKEFIVLQASPTA